MFGIGIHDPGWHGGFLIGTWHQSRQYDFLDYELYYGRRLLSMAIDTRHHVLQYAVEFGVYPAVFESKQDTQDVHQLE